MVEKTNNIDDAEIKYKQALKNYHKESNRHVLVLEADATEEQKRMILHTSNLIRIAGNCLATVMKRNYEQLVRTKRYRNLKSLYKKAKDTDDKKLLASVTAQIQEIQESYNVTWDFCRKEMNKIKDIYHINSIFARSKAEDVWSGIKKCLYGDGNTIHFKKYGDYPEIRAKEIKRGISVYPVVSDNGNNSLKLHIMKSEFNLTVNKPKHNKTRSGNIISDILEPHDRFAEEITRKFSHTRPDGTDSSTALYENGVSCSCGENIAAGQKTPEAVVRAWMNSPGHKAAILDPDATHIGVGVCKSPITGQWLWVQDFSYNPDAKGSVIFDANGGVFSSNNSNQLIISGPVDAMLKVSKVEIPIKDGYTFAGWEDGITEVGIQEHPMRILATWTPISES